MASKKKNSPRPAKKKASKKKVAAKTRAKKKVAKKKSSTEKSVKLGRPRLLDQDRLAIQKNLVKHLKEGYYIEDACILAGCTKSSYYRWIEHAEILMSSMNELVMAGKEPPEINNDDMVFLEFWEAIKQAEISIKGDAVKSIKKAFKQSDGWRAAIAFLERRFPKEWGKTNNVHLSDPEGKPISVQFYIPDNGR